MGYSGSIYQQLGSKAATQIFYEGKGDGESCMIYPQIYHFNKRKELSISAITKTVNMLNSSSASYNHIAYEMEMAYKSIYALSDILGIEYVDVFDDEENFLLVSRIESSDECGNSPLVSFYEKKVLEDEERVAKLPPIMEKRHFGRTTPEQLTQARRNSQKQIKYMQIFSAFNRVVERSEIEKMWEDVINIKTKCDILKLINRMNNCLIMLNNNYMNKFNFAKKMTNLLYHYKNKINSDTKVFVSYCDKILCFECMGEDDVKIEMPYDKSFIFSTLFGDWAGSGAQITTKKELMSFISIFEYVPETKRNYFIETYFKKFIEKVSEDDLYEGQTFSIHISGGY